MSINRVGGSCSTNMCEKGQSNNATKVDLSVGISTLLSGPWSSITIARVAVRHLTPCTRRRHAGSKTEVSPRGRALSLSLVGRGVCVTLPCATVAWRQSTPGRAASRPPKAPRARCDGWGFERHTKAPANNAQTPQRRIAEGRHRLPGSQLVPTPPEGARGAPPPSVSCCFADSASLAHG